jgi:hypothetical protein
MRTPTETFFATMLLLLLVPSTLAFVSLRPAITNTRHFLSYTTNNNSQQDEAQALLDRARKIRQELADLQGVSLEQVEQEAQQRKDAEQQRQLQQQEQRLQEQQQRRESQVKKATSMQGRMALDVPDTFDEQVYQAKQAIERAYQDGLTRQVVRFALITPDQPNLMEQDQQWPGGVQQMFRQAAQPLTRALLTQLRVATKNNQDNNNSVFKKPTLAEEDIYDFDGSALLSASISSSSSSSSTDTTDASNTLVTQAMVFPNTDDKYTRDIEQLDQKLQDKLFLLINPFWRNVDSWGINWLAPNAKKNAQRVIFDRGFQETYCLIQKSTRGEDCVALKCYPYDWQLYAYADGESWPFQPYLVHLGSTTSEPTEKDFGECLSERSEFKLSKTMRQMNQMRR